MSDHIVPMRLKYPMGRGLYPIKSGDGDSQRIILHQLVEAICKERLIELAREAGTA